MSDRHPEWREQPDYPDWPDYEGEPSSRQGGENGRHHGDQGPRQAGERDWPDDTTPPRQRWTGARPEQPGRRWPDPGTPPAGGPAWRDAAGHEGGGWQGTGEQAVPGWRDPAQAEQGGRHDSGQWSMPEWRDVGQSEPRPGRHDADRRPGPERHDAPPDPGWHDPGGQPAPPDQPGAAPGTDDSGRVVADRAQRNSGRITGRLTRRNDRGSLFRGRRGAAGAAPAQPPAPEETTAERPRYGEAPDGSGFAEPAAQPGWPAEQPGGGQPWAPERPWTPEARGAAPGEESLRPTPPLAWRQGGETGFAEPPRFAEPPPEPHPHPGYGEAPGYGAPRDYDDAAYGEAPAGAGEFGLEGFGHRDPRGPAYPEELAARPAPAGQEWDQEWDEDEEPGEADEAGAPQPGRRVGPQAPAAAAEQRQRSGSHRRTRSRALPRVKVGQARVPQAGLALAGIAILVAGGLVGLMRMVPKAPGPSAADAGAPYSARWVCPLLPNSVGTVTANNVGQRAASLEAASDRGPAGGGQQQLAARATRVFHAQGGPNGGFVQVEAFGAPVAASSAGQPPCVAGPATRWWLPGLSSSGDTKVTLVIVNPETSDATVNITPHLTEGSLHPEALQNVFVRGGATVLKDINVPEVQTLDYTAEVVASQGRVVVGARLDSKIGNKQQRLVVPAQPAMRSSWAFSGGLGGEARQVELLVTNPNPNPLSLVVEGVNDQGPFKVPGFDFPIGDGAINQAPVPVDLGKAAVFGLRVRSQDGSKFVAALRYGSGGGAINSTYLDIGGSGLDARWMAPVVPTSRRLVLANTGSGPVTATLSPLGGAPAGAGATAQAGKGGSVTVEPGQVRFTDVPKGVQSLLLLADAPGLVAAPVGPGQLVPGSDVGGVPLEAAVTPGPAAAP